jgi:HK97 family phage prohead protease
MMDNITGVLKAKKDDIYTIIASSKAVDRDNEIILPSAFKNLDSYLKNNPVVLGFHNYQNFPIGKAVSGKITDNELYLDIKFAETEQGKEARYLYDNGFMNSFSVGFIPKVWDYDKDNRRVYSEVEILEVSAVPVPSNAAAVMLREAKAKGFELKYFASQEETESKDTAKAETPEIKELIVDEKINKLKRKYLWI